jgi:6-phosphogluconolactonase
MPTNLNSSKVDAGQSRTKRSDSSIQDHRRATGKRALDLDAPEGYIGMWSPSAPHARLSLNLRALLDSRRILIFLLGEAKWRTYAAACGPGPVEEMPVRAVLRQERVPVEVVWAP